MNKLFRADLHCHSHYSDGTDSPEALIDLAIKQGLSALSITDHDSTLVYEEALPLAQEKNFPLLPGIELSAHFDDEPIHVLGYAFSLKSEELRAFCLRHKHRREVRNRAILEKLERLGIVISLDELQTCTKTHTIGRPHIAQALMKKGVVSSVKEGFDRFLGAGKLAYVKGETFSVLETIEIIHKASGLAVIAHPHLIRRKKIVKSILEMPFDGVEGYYAHFEASFEKPWVEIAHKKGWLITGGSDYHGAIKPRNQLGSSWVDETTFNTLYKHYQALQ